MNKILGLLLVLIVSCKSLGQSPSYKTHKVGNGETVATIASKYGITKSMIFKLNPDAQDGVYPNDVLIIPTGAASISADGAAEQRIKGYKNHKVKRKETLYGISRKYGLTIDELKKYNNSLYSNELKKGMVLSIPQFETVSNKSGNVETSKEEVKDIKDVPFISGDPVVDGVAEVTNQLPLATKDYIVQPKDTKWGIAHRNGITIDVLQQLNPTMGDVLSIGQVLKLSAAEEETATAQVPTGEEAIEGIETEHEEPVYYVVKPKEGFYRLHKKLGITQEELEALNPALKEKGLVAGMVLKLPSSVKESFDVNNSLLVENFDLTTHINTLETVNVAMLLPFGLDKVNTADDLTTRTSLEKEKSLMNASLDFYTGALMAMEEAKKLGVNANVKVLDTEYQPGKSNAANNAAKISNLMLQNSFEGVQAVIGPLVPTNVNKVATQLQSKKIPVISPVSSKSIGMRSNVVNTVPTEDDLRSYMIDYIAHNSEDKNVIVITDAKSATIKSKLLSRIPGALHIAPQEGNYIKEPMIDSIMVDKPNWVILETEDLGLITNATSKLNSLITPEKKITLLTTHRSKEYDNENINNRALANLNFHYPSGTKNTYHKEFFKAYREAYNMSPNKYVQRGYDVTLDVLLRLANDKNFYQGMSSFGTTEQLDGRFNYQRSAIGYHNKGIYILQYEGLDIKVVK